MLEKIKTCICHPSRIGAYFKDSIPKNILFLFLFIILYIVFSASILYNADHFNNQHSSMMTDSIVLHDENGIYFDSETDKLYRVNDEKISIAGNQYRMNFFCEVSSGFQQSEIILNFKETYVDVVLFGTKIGTLNYADHNFESFSLINIKNGSYNDKLSFQKMIDYTLDEINTEYTTISVGAEFINLLEDILFTLVLCVILSLFVNPEIKLNVRIRLCMLDTVVHIICLIFAVLFSAGWLEYLGMFLACFYTCSTFRHIVRVKKSNF